jgi:hypothetical protein
MFDPNKPTDVTRLDEALYAYREMLDPFRKHTAERIKIAAGKTYSDSGTPDKRPLNSSALNIGIYSHRLMSANPQVLFSTQVQELEESALEQEAAVNEWIRRTDAGRALNEAVVHALYAGFGVVQVGICPYRYAADDPGQTRVYSIAIDDWVHDMTAKRFEDCSVMGHRYRVSIDELLNDPSIPDERKAHFSAHDIHNTEAGKFKIQSISQGDRYIHDHFEPEIELWQIWLPRYRLICTFEASDDSSGTTIIKDKPLRVMEWEGPRSGPYHIVDFLPLPNNTIGLAPAGLWEELDDAINKIANKVIRDCETSKRIGLYQLDDVTDAQTIQGTPNGGLAGVQNPQAINQIELGGPNQNLMGAVSQLRMYLNLYSGNTDQLGGLGAQTDTVGQERLLAAGASVNLNSMSARTIAWAEGVFRDSAYWLLSDPRLQMHITKKLPETNLTVPFKMTADRVQGTADDYRIQIDPYTMSFSTPQEKLAQLLGVMERAVFPLMGPMMQQGAQFDFQYFIDTLARLSGRPEISRLIQFVGPPNENLAESSGQMPSATTRTYNRRDTAGNSMQSQEQELMKSLMTAGSSGQAA